jgi:penicillin-binding protein 2
VIIENGGFGSTWAGPMAYLLIEKYLTDSLREDVGREVDRIAAANLMPSYLTREQYKATLIRAYEWFKMTKDSSYIDKYTYQKTELPLSRKKSPHLRKEIGYSVHGNYRR